MKVLRIKAGSLILKHTVWVFATMILFISYLMILADPPNTVISYLSNFLQICFLFSPILLLAAFRDWLKGKWKKGFYSALWMFCFILYPILLIKIAGSPSAGYFQHSKIILSFGPTRFLLAISITLLLTEIALLFNDHLLEWIGQNKWLQGITLEKSILGLCLLLSIMLGIIGMLELMERPDKPGLGFMLLQLFRFLSFTLQFFLILLAYYFFYYCNHYFLIPKVLKDKGVVYYGFSLAALILLAYPILVGLIRFLPIVQDLSIGQFTNHSNLFAEDGGGLPFTIMVLSVPIIVSKQWFQQHSAIALLEQEKTERELSLLKQQINPHFFFNTLNNLYALSLTKDKATPEVILQLSALMRYVIYKGKEEVVTLKEEVKYIEDYIRLQQIRLPKDLDFIFEKQISDEEAPIPPLLFIILVENAFKHGIEPAEQPAFLHLCLQSRSDQLSFTCVNSVEGKENVEKGIGLDNLRRRLELLFPGKYSLELDQTPGVFKAILQLNFK